MQLPYSGDGQTSWMECKRNTDTVNHSRKSQGRHDLTDAIRQHNHSRNNKTIYVFFSCPLSVLILDVQSLLTWIILAGNKRLALATTNTAKAEVQLYPVSPFINMHSCSVNCKRSNENFELTVVSMMRFLD